MADPSSLDTDVNDLLHSALESSFSPVDSIPRLSSTEAPHEPTPDTASSKPATAPVTEPASQAALAESAADDTGSASVLSADEWKAEYDAQIASFRAHNAVQREKAERERARWEKIRAEEAEEARAHTAAAPAGPLVVSGRVEGHASWENVQGPAASASPSTLHGSPSPADVRALVAGEPEGHTHIPIPPSITHASPPRHGGPSSEHSGEHSGSEVPESLTSSLPSDFDVETPASERQHGRHHPHASRAPVPAPPPFGEAVQAARQQRRDERGDGTGDGAPPLAVTPMIFDSSLPTRTRVYALFASLGINLLLPFVNGVMLGFGEIYAKEVICVWLGWVRPGSSVASGGVRKGASEKARFWERKKQ